MGLQLKKLPKALTAIMVLALLQGQLPAAEAAFLPYGGAATIKRLSVGGYNESAGKFDLSYVPVLLDLARVIGRYEPEPGYFLQNEPLASEPGIDLRDLLLQAGPLQLSQRLAGEAGEIPSAPDRPNLALPIISNQTASPPASDSPLQVAMRPLSPEEVGDTTVRQVPENPVGSPDQIILALSGNKLDGTPVLITLDFTGLSAALGHHGEQIRQSSQDIPRVRTASYISPTNAMTAGRPVNSGFLLWTLRPGTTGATTGEEAIVSNMELPYLGTFVACSPDVRFKNLSHRHLTLQPQGRIAAGNRGSELTFDTSLGSVRLETGTSAIIDQSDRQTLRVMSLESSPSGDVYVDYNESSGARRTLKVPPGEELVLSAQTLTPEQISGLDGIERTSISQNANVARNKFSVHKALEHDSLLNDGAPELTAMQRSALNQLKQRLMDNRQVSK